jgi:hypothetical protein
MLVRRSERGGDNPVIDDSAKVCNRPSPRADAWLLARETYELLYRQST